MTFFRLAVPSAVAKLVGSGQTELSASLEGRTTVDIIVTHHGSRDLGAKVYGYALPPEHRHDLFYKLGLKNLIHHQDGDIRDPRKLCGAMNKAKPEFVFHLAAQALVRRSYKFPQETFETNV